MPEPEEAAPQPRRPITPGDACDLCGAITLKLHCKDRCEQCGAIRDCSDL